MIFLALNCLVKYFALVIKKTFKNLLSNLVDLVDFIFLRFPGKQLNSQ